MSIFDQLLLVQDNDTSTDQLRHRRINLSERADVTAADAALVDVEKAIADNEARTVEMTLRQRHLEVDVAAIEERVTATDAKLYSGNVTALKELEALQHEIASMRSQQAGVEDEIIALMEGLEAASGEAEDLAAQKVQRAAAIDEAARKLTVAEAEIDAELERVADERAAAAAVVPDDVLADYERLRAQLGGVAVAKLQGNLCLGCHLSLSAIEIDRIKHEPPEVAVTCGECGRILVR